MLNLPGNEEVENVVFDMIFNSSEISFDNKLCVPKLAEPFGYRMALSAQNLALSQL